MGDNLYLAVSAVCTSVVPVTAAGVCSGEDILGCATAPASKPHILLFTLNPWMQGLCKALAENAAVNNAGRDLSFVQLLPEKSFFI